jgi:spore germination cell wall hydrolase CwlJ-like protein
VAVKRSNRRKPGGERGELLFEDEEKSAGFSQVLSFTLAGMALVGAFAFAGLEMGKNANARSVSSNEWVEVISPATNLVRKGSFITSSPSDDLIIAPQMRPQAVLASAKADLLGDDNLLASPSDRTARLDTLVLTPPVWKIEKTWRLGQEQKQKVLSERQQRLTEASCLARAVYFEARSESELGQLAVARVIINRVNDPNYPKSICDVVYQGAGRLNSCQFSFACDGASDTPKPGDAWNQAQRVAARAMSGDNQVQIISTATHYHADYVKPRWSDSLNRLIKIGHHIFYSDS